jgi:hypothetical protein
LRSGSTSAAGDIASKVGASGMEARRKAAQDAEIQALDYTDKKYNTQRAGLSDLYGRFAQLAGKDLGASMQPGAGPQAATALMDRFSQMGNQANPAYINAAAKEGGTMGNFEPRMGQANMWGAIGSSLAGLGDRLGAMGQNQQNDQLLRDYISHGGQLSLNQGGIMPLMESRVMGGSGGWAGG